MEKPCVEDVVKMISKEAWLTWKKLPPQHKIWIDVADLASDGLLFIQSNILPRYHPRRMKFSTFVFLTLENFYKNQLERLFAAKRNLCTPEPIEDYEQKLSVWDETGPELEALQALSNVISDASPVLRYFLHEWLFVRENIHTCGKTFAVASAEMRKLCEKHNLDRTDLEYLLGHEGWLRGFQHVQIAQLQSVKSIRRFL
jgi:hypothetical protein